MGNTVANVAVLTAATGAIAKGVELISTNLWGGIAVLVAGIVLVVLYEKMPVSAA
ncbi:MAG: hypothetical protein ACREGC_00360 [Minisyncoccia bacterium]